MIAPARLAAYRALRSIHDDKLDLASALERQRQALTDDRDRGLAAEITYGTLRWRGTLDFLITRAGHRDATAFDPEVLDLLRMSAYQLLYLDRVPQAAVISDAVNLCKKERKTSASGAVNAILRRMSRERNRLDLPDEAAPLDFLSVSLSLPRWLAERWLNRLGFDVACAWARFSNDPAPMTLRANGLKTTRASLSEALLAEGVTTAPARFAPDALIVTAGNPLRTALAASGHFLVQDESSQMVAGFAAVQPGERVLDTCAAPGGKTTQMAADAGGRAHVVASDVRPRRMRLLAETVGTMGARVDLLRADWMATPALRPVFDCVLVDAPCSGLGTIRRDPDIKWRRTEEDLRAYGERQLTMLLSAAQAVAPGGRLIYSTCSSEPEENDAVIAALLAQDPRFREEGDRFRPSPHAEGLEPFFAARLRRIP